MNQTPRVPLILGRCFLKTGRDLIDVHKGELTLRIGSEAITYNLDQTVRYSTNYNQMTANKIDVICEEYSQEVLGFSNTTASGNPTPHYDPIVSTMSPTITPFGDSDFLLFEEADAFLECSSCGTLYTRDCSCSKGNVEDKILVPKPPKNCARCGHPVDGPYCQGCTFLQKKLEEDLVTHFQGFQNTFESSDDSTNIVNIPLEHFVVKQDHGNFVDKVICGLNKAPDSPHLHTFSPNQFHCFHCKDALEDGEACQRCTCKRFGSGLSKGLCLICGSNQNSPNDSPISANSSHNPPHIDERCFECGDALDGIFCQQCACKFRGKGAHIGYNCPPKVSIISNPEPCNQTMNNEPPLEVEKIVIPEDEEIEDDNLRENLLKVNLLISKIKALRDNPTLSFEFLTKSSSTSAKSFLEGTNTFHNSLPEFKNFCFNLEEISSGSTTTHSDLSLPKSDSTHEEFADELAHIISPPEYDCFYFRELPDSGELISSLNSRIRKNLYSTTCVNLLVEDDYSPLLVYVVWIFLSYLTYPIIPPYLHSFGN
nr:reverse transcriptase domain-containing protein [Tanacetum cinerariifolium]